MSKPGGTATVTATVTATASFVRPYVLTGGRTRAERYLGLETLVSTRWPDAAGRRFSDELYRAVVQLCSRPVSVAEVAALMAVPLGVARVLIGDLASGGHLIVHRSSSPDGTPSLDLLRRVLGGLQRL